VISDLRGWMRAALEERLEAPALAWYEEACAEIGGGCADERFSRLFSMASRHARGRPVELTAAEHESAARLVSGWNPERWTRLDLLRVGLILSRPDLERETTAPALCGMAKFADMGELCALYRSFCLLPRPDDYAWQAGEGCRTNMNAVFEAMACDNPYPVRHFDDVAWRALVVKSIFIGAPLWRVEGLDARLSEELAHVALDLADERRSAGRPVPPELWLALGTFGGQRAIDSLLLETSAEVEAGRAGAALGLARAGRGDLLTDVREREQSPLVLATIDRALEGQVSQLEFRALHPDD